MTLLDFVRMLRRYWFAPLAGLIVGAVAAFGLLMAQTPLYAATTTCFVTVGSSARTAADLNDSGQFALREVASYPALADSPLVLQPVIAELHLTTTVPELAKHVSATNPATTVLVLVTAQDPSPAKAAQLSKAVSEQLVRVVESLENSTPATAKSAVYLKIASQALVPQTPVSPKRTLTLAVGALAGLALGVIVALALDYRRMARRPEETDPVGPAPLPEQPDPETEATEPAGEDADEDEPEPADDTEPTEPESTEDEPTEDEPEPGDDTEPTQPESTEDEPEPVFGHDADVPSRQLDTMDEDDALAADEDDEQDPLDDAEGHLDVDEDEQDPLDDAEGHLDIDEDEQDPLDDAEGHLDIDEDEDEDHSADDEAGDEADEQPQAERLDGPTARPGSPSRPRQRRVRPRRRG